MRASKLHLRKLAGPRAPLTLRLTRIAEPRRWHLTTEGFLGVRRDQMEKQRVRGSNRGRSENTTEWSSPLLFEGSLVFRDARECR